ncbi:MAG TPA: hypothetical protein VG733_05240 [Chthoniobacteraceae bacterium]|nr:hypothetical protein [Chthoniobacteraceae bacterium]
MSRWIRFIGGMGLLDYPWSSIAQGYGLEARKRAPWLETRAGFELAGRRDTAGGRRQMIVDLERRAPTGRGVDRGTAQPFGQTLNSTLQRGWYWGSQDFRERLIALMQGNKAEFTRRERANLHGENAASRLADLRFHGILFLF